MFLTEPFHCGSGQVQGLSFKLTFLLVHKLNLCEDVDIVLKSSVFILFVQLQFV